MRILENFNVFHEFSGHELSRELDETWRLDFESLAVNLHAWLDGARCVVVFTVDDAFQQPDPPVRVDASFSVGGHDALVLEGDAIDVNFLHAAYLFAEPQYYLRTTALPEEARELLQSCVKQDGEDRFRGGEFDERKLWQAFGDYIVVSGWSSHYMVNEADALAMKAERDAWLEAERTKPLRRKIRDAVPTFFFIAKFLACMLAVPFAAIFLFCLKRWKWILLLLLICGAIYCGISGGFLLDSLGAGL